jgi:spermidine/putrescine transport system substrate-binding protein
MTDNQRAVLRWDEQGDFLQKTQLYPAPDTDLDNAMQDLWLDKLSQ